MGLKTYIAKRDFSKTAEPKGGKPLPKKVKGASRFVIQKHNASRLHYDFRLEMDGVLKSWAVPKGLPWAQGEKHLAVEVEDHPLEYATFEGIIPEGEYGGGTVMVWDRGNYYVYGEQPVKSLREGKMHLVLEGEKAKGEWTLVRIRSEEAKNQWLILKTGASAKPLSKKREDESVKTSSTMKEIADEHDAEWESNREEKDASARSTLKARIKATLKKKESVGRDNARPARTRTRREGRDAALRRPGHRSAMSLPELPSAKPRFIEPMKPRRIEEPPPNGDWIYELKFDGIRAIAVKDGSKVNLISRNENELRTRFPEIADAVKKLSTQECVIDGEVVALDEEGRSSFQLLQALELEGRKAPVRFYVFDLLQIDGKSLIKLPLAQRKELLAKLCESIGDPIRFSGGCLLVLDLLLVGVSGITERVGRGEMRLAAARRGYADQRHQRREADSGAHDHARIVTPHPRPSRVGAPRHLFSSSTTSSPRACDVSPTNPVVPRHMLGEIGATVTARNAAS